MTAPGSVENIFNAVSNPKLEFQGKDIPKGSPAFQLVVTDVEKEKHKDSSDDDDETDGNKSKKPSKEYMGRRRNTVASLHSNMRHFDIHTNARRLSMIPERGRSQLLDVPRGSRARSLSPISEGSSRRGSLAFGSTTERETILH